MATDNIVLIIGAGPAGLAIAGQLAQAGIPYRILEQSERVANAWHHHYDRLHLHTTRKYSALPGLPFDRSFPKYIPRAMFAEYCRNYAAHFQIQPEFGVEVTMIHRRDDGWELETRSGKRYRGVAVVVATGMNKVPRRPQWPGMDDFRGGIEHSREYRNGRALHGRKVLVVGMGNTGAEIALDLLEHGALPSISIRGPVNVVRRDVLGRATTDTAVLLHRLKLPPLLFDKIAVFFQKLTVGDLTRYGISRPPYAPSRQQREHGTTPMIDVGTLAEIKNGRIAMRPAIRRFTETDIEFVDESIAPFDHVVLATGYRPGLRDYFDLPDIDRLLDARGLPAAIQFAQYPSLFFIGFDSCISGQLYCIREASAEICQKIRLRFGE